MLYVIHALDKPGHLQLRLDTRPAHLEYLKSVPNTLHLGGPLMEDDHETAKGTLIVIEAENLEAAESVAVNDPYNKAGLFASVTVTALNKTIGWVD
jgi:uncharacterized protein YciI